MLQLKKSVRLESLRLPFKKALFVAAQLGADGVEINARAELRAADMTRTAVRQLRKILADLKLNVSAIHFPTRRGYGVSDDLDQRIDATKSAMKMAYDLGCHIVVNHVGRVPEDPQDDCRSTMVQALTDLGNHSQKSGAWLVARTGSESGELLQSLIQSLPAHSIGVDFDPGDLIINGFSATESMQALGAHIMNFRAHDAVTDLSAGQGVEVQLGRGSTDWVAMLSLLEEHNYSGYLAVERNTDENPVQQCGEAFEYLANLFQ